MIDVKIDYEACEDNRFCFEVCPEDVFALRNSKIVVDNADTCTMCWLCVNNCPTGAVTIEG